MISFSACREGSVPARRLSAIDTTGGSAGPLLKRRPSPAGHPKTHRARIGGAAALVLTCLLLAAPAVPSAASEVTLLGRTGPDDADMRYYVECSKTAATRILSFDEAAKCTRTFLRIKLSFVPGVDIEDFDALPPREKAAINLAGYERYLDWSAENAAEVEALWDAPMSSSDFSGN